KNVCVSKLEGGVLMKGRNKLPVEQKKLAGTFRSDRFKNGLQFTQLNICPDAPLWLDISAKKKFNEVALLLISKQMLYDADIHLLAILAKELSVYEMACAELKTKTKFIIETKSGYKQPSPWVAIRSQAQKNVREIGSLFGLDPLSRSRFNIKDEKPEENQFSTL
ncbi:MAG: phage terminase small subunit P27 family, partial [Desulfobulbaceae bacterium]|nr:phage terminase small subunit P27 family [Desulfobulbaceae bacterium]